MPWSTWTTRSPTLRSRRSERNVLARFRRFSDGAALLLEDVRLGVDLQRRVGEPEAARQRADGDEHRRRMRVLGAFDRHGDDVVLPQDLDRALGAAVAVGDEEHGVAALARLADLGDPVADPAAELHRRLAGDVADLRLLSDGQLFEPRRAAGRARSMSLHVEKRLVRRQRRRRGRAPPHRRSSSRAGRGPCAPAPRPARTPRRRRARRATSPRNSITGTAAPVVVEPLADRHDQELIGRAGRPLRRRIEPPQRFDHVADELDADRLGVAGREDVDDAAADRERAVLVDRILAREAGVDEQVGEILRLDLGARPDLERGAQQPLRRADPRQQRRRRGDDQAAPCRSRRRAARGRAPPPRGSAGSCRDTDRPAATETAGPRARRPPRTRPRARRRRTARRRSAARRPCRSARRAASALRPARRGDRGERLGRRRQPGGHRRELVQRARGQRPG